MLSNPEKLLDLISDVTTTLGHYIILIIDHELTNCILLTFRHFMTASSFLDAIISRFYCQLPKDATEADALFFNEFSSSQKKRMLDILLLWVSDHWYDFGVDSKLRERLACYLEAVRQDEDAVLSSFFLKIMKIAVTGHAVFKQRLENNLNNTTHSKKLGHTDFIDRFAPEMIAKNLAHYNLKLFQSILPSEILLELWRVDEGEQTLTFKKFVNRFDMESNWVVCEICVNAKTQQEKTKILTKFINIASVYFN